jgi:exopolyphosphatase/guanosine-5'-triphosphate,3'-diphosphate pyrophosphatase
MKVAAVDIGTNTVRLLLADVVPDREGHRLAATERHEVITKLGEGLDASGTLGDVPMGRALAGLGYFAELIRGADVQACAGVATAATRSASNGPEFAERVATVLGFAPRVIDGVEEARLTFNGATNALPSTGSVCVIDVGGGSTEFVIGEHYPDYAVSIDIGSVRLTERISKLGLSDPDEIRAYVDTLFDGVLPPYAPDRILGSGGTFTTVAAVRDGSDAVDAVLSFADMQSTVDRLLTLTPAGIAALPAVSPARAGVLQAGAICAERAVAHLGGVEIAISVSDILDGLALELAGS